MTLGFVNTVCRGAFGLGQHEFRRRISTPKTCACSDAARQPCERFVTRQTKDPFSSCGEVSTGHWSQVPRNSWKTR